jgi:hypothetical protein
MAAQLKLPVFEATNSEDFSQFLVVWCPREDCFSYTERPFLVHKSTWLKRRLSTIARKDGKAVVLRGRPCPYCSKVSEVPARVNIR